MPAGGPINANLAGALLEKVEEVRQSGSKNFIIDLQGSREIDRLALHELIGLHEECYSQEESLVFTGITEPVMAVIKKEELDLMLNIAPSMREAIDIISMEILERDLLGEE
jgi:anti-anti-sigma regulatory factor